MKVYYLKNGQGSYARFDVYEGWVADDNILFAYVFPCLDEAKDFKNIVNYTMICPENNFRVISRKIK